MYRSFLHQMHTAISSSAQHVPVTIPLQPASSRRNLWDTIHPITYHVTRNYGICSKLPINTSQGVLMTVAAVDVVKAEFDTWKGAELKSISFTSDMTCADNLAYRNGMRSSSGLPASNSFTECL